MSERELLDWRQLSRWTQKALPHLLQADNLFLPKRQLQCTWEERGEGQSALGRRLRVEGSNKTAVFTRETQTLKNTLWESYRIEKNGKRKFHQPHPQQQTQPSGTQNT